MGHTLVIYRGSERADAALAELARVVRERRGKLTVLALAVEERVGRGCCDTRSVLWNRIQREFAANELARARIVIDDVAPVDGTSIEFAVLRHSGRRTAEAVEREARRAGAGEIVIADPRACGLPRRAQRRLRELAPAT